MKKFARTLLSIIIEALYEIKYLIENNLRNICWLLNFMLPYFMYFIGRSLVIERGNLAIGSEIFVPIFICVVVYFIRSYANKIGKGSQVPIPEKRFTTIDDYGEVSIENNRVQELILYTADLEDYLQRKGLL